MLAFDENETKKLFRIKEIAAISKVNERTLQRWIDKGQMINFVTCYRSKHGANFYRLGKPLDTDELIPNSEYKYQLKNKKGDWI